MAQPAARARLNSIKIEYLPAKELIYALNKPKQQNDEPQQQ